jgi:hypothetical protein
VATKKSDEPALPVATAETTFDKNGAGMTVVSGNVDVEDNTPLAIVIDGIAYNGGMAGVGGSFNRPVAVFTGPFQIKSGRKGDDRVLAEGVA